MNIYKVHARFLAFFVNKLVEPLISRDSIVSKAEKKVVAKIKLHFFICSTTKVKISCLSDSRHLDENNVMHKKIRECPFVFNPRSGVSEKSDADRLWPDFRFANIPGRMKILQKKLHSGFVIDNAF